MSVAIFGSHNRQLVVVGILSFGAILSSSYAAGASTKTSSGENVVSTAKSAKLGTYLVTTKGMTLYRYSSDKTDKATCTGSCATTWPPLLLASGATSAKGQNGVEHLGTIKTSGGLQVTYEGHPLYRFEGDKKSGATNGENVEDKWFVIVTAVPKQAFTAVHTTPTTTAPSQSSSAPVNQVASPTTTSVAPAAPTTTEAPTTTTTPHAAAPTVTTTTNAPVTTTTTPHATTTTTTPPTSGGYGY